jgi:ribonuclease HI
MTIAVTYEERIALIKRIAERKKTLAKVKTKSRSVFDVMDKYEDTEKRNAKFVEEDKSKNDNHWTDAPKYANQYYGEVYRETTRFDNDWE